LTRRLAKWLALLVGGETENRGKRDAAGVVERAAARGFTRVLFIYENKGNPSRLVFHDSDKGWLEPEVIVSGAAFPEKAGADGRRLRLPGRAVFKALEKKWRIFGELLGLETLEADEDDFVEVKAGGENIFFEYGGAAVGPRLRAFLGPGKGN